MKNKILFHHFKHHFRSNLRWLKQQNGWEPETEKQLKTLGASRLDYYTGMLTYDEIKAEIMDILSIEDILTPEQYIFWLGSKTGYREISLSDQSWWTLRYIEDTEFIHIHPPNTIRIKANTLKTVLCVLLVTTNKSDFNPDAINVYRERYLNLSPIKITGNNNELKRIFNLFISQSETRNDT